jgi:hypothetical protein
MSDCSNFGDDIRFLSVDGLKMPRERYGIHIPYLRVSP